MKLDLVILASCFATSEGFFAPGNPPPVRNNNPGDLRFAGQQGAIRADATQNTFAHFDSPQRGTVALLRQLCADIQTGANLTQTVYSWAPPTDGNNSALYLSETIRRYKAATGDTIDPTVPLWNYLVLVHIP